MYVALGAAIVACALVFAGHPGRIVSDTPYEFFARPDSGFRHTLDLWDASTGMGRVFPRYHPLVYLPPTVFHALGASPWVTQRLWHALLLVIAGLGAVAVARRFDISRGPAVLSGIVYALGPTAITAFMPSLLYMNYALSPWLMLIALSLPRAGARRAGAAFALVFFLGSVNLPALAYSTLPAGVALLWLMTARHVRMRVAVAFAAVTVTLWVAMMTPYLIQVGQGSDILTTNLNTTESLEAISLNSSLTESLRGLGLWLLYFDLGQGPTIERAAFLIDFEPLAIASFILPAAAIVGFMFTSSSRRRLWLALMSISVLLMSGSFGADDSSMFAAAVRWGIEDVPGLFALRNHYKAATGLALAVAIGIGLLGDRLARHPRRAVLLVLGAVGVLVGALASSFVGHNLYDTRQAADGGVPRYYQEAADWLNAQPGGGRVLVAPTGSSTSFRWGNGGPEILEALVDRPILQQTVLPVGSPDAANAVDALQKLTAASEYRHGSLGPLARRYGIGYVVIRNDQVWEELDLPRPAQLTALRTDPDLELAASFGTPGSNTLAAFDTAGLALGEQLLPPLEVYRVRQGGAVVRGTADDTPLLVAGDATALVALHARGVLDDAMTTRYTGRMTTDELVEALAGGSVLAVTDTNRRRIDRAGAAPGVTLAMQDSTSAVANLFGRARTQSVASYPDAALLSETPAATLFPVPFENRPAAAFDQDPSTSWQTGFFAESAGQTLRVDFGELRPVRTVRVTRATPGPGERMVSALLIRTSGGGEVRTEIGLAGDATATFDDEPVRWVEVKITGVSGAGLSSYGLAEVEIDDFDIREFIRAPDDAIRDGGADLEAALRTAPIIYSFELGGPGLGETAFRREFYVPAARAFALEGSLSSLDNAGAPIESAGTCRTDLVWVDGEAIPVRITAVHPAGEAAPSVSIEGCALLNLGEGDHRIEQASGVSVLWVTLSTGETVNPPPRVVDVSPVDGSSYRFAIPPVDNPFVLISGQSFDPEFRLDVGDQTLPPVERDGLAAFDVRADAEPRTARLFRTPDRRFRASLWLSGLALLVALGLALWRREAPVLAPEALEATRPPRRFRRRFVRLAMIGAPALAGWLLAGLVGLAVGLAAGAFAGVRVPHDQPWQVRSLLGAAAIGLVIAGIISVASGPAAVSLGYVRQRPASEPWAAAVIILVFAATLPPRHRHPNANQPDDGGPTGPTET